MKNRLIVFERATAANARKTMIVGAGRRAQRHLTAVEFVLLFTPRLVGKNAGVHPARSRDRAASSQRVPASYRNNEMVDFP